MPSSKALHKLHLLGYCTTAIVIIEFGAFGSFYALDWMRNRNIDAVVIESTRTHDGQLSAQLDKNATKLLNELPALRSLGANAFRFGAMPSLGNRWFGLAMSVIGNEAAGVLVSATRSNNGDLVIETKRSFRMSLQAYEAMIARVDRLSDGWKGDSGRWLDGTIVAFERVSGTHVTSGIGNSATHYGKLATMVRNDLLPFLPEVAALDDTWMNRSATGAQ